MKKKQKYLKDKSNELPVTLRTRTLETCIEEKMNLRVATNRKIIY
jgi:hypothetical protein